MGREMLVGVVPNLCIVLRVCQSHVWTVLHMQPAKMTGSSSPNGLKDDPKVKASWAKYISYFISAYEAAGVNIWAGIR